MGRPKGSQKVSPEQKSSILDMYDVSVKLKDIVEF